MAKKRKKEKLTLKSLDYRVETLEKFILTWIERDKGITDHSVPMHEVREVCSPIGYKRG